MSQPRSAPPDLPGYTLVQGIGGGGFADVFLYRQLHPSRPVAIKILRAEHLSDASLQQFATEADIMAQVSAHPYIVTIYSSGVAPDGRPFIVMEHYPGQHFGLRARGGRLAVSEVLRVGVQVASAVETAHRAGILHRDIKPANILTSEYGRPGLTDFGISGVRIGGDVSAAEGLTVAFSSPEVLLEEGATGSEVSDVYSLAATLYSLVAGHSPFWVPGGDNTEGSVLQRVITGQITPITRDDAPPSLKHLLANGMATDPASRPASALALARALQSIEQELALAPTPVEVRDDLTVAPAGHDEPSASDEDGTRRAAPRVVNPDAPPTAVDQAAWAPPTGPAVAPAAPRPPAFTTPPSPSPWAPATTPAQPQGSAAPPDDPDTVMRPKQPATAAAASPVEPTSGGVPRPVLIAGGAVAALIVAGLIALGLRGGGQSDQATTTTVPGTRPTVVSNPPPEPPTNVVGALDGAGTLTVSFEPTNAAGSVSYRLERAQGAWADGNQWIDVPAPPATIPGNDPAVRVCFTVSTISDGRISDESVETCADPAPPAAPVDGAPAP